MQKKKVLIITYYWPPAGGPGVQRWLKFAKYLPEFNIEPIVYCPENPNYPITDVSLEAEISENITILKQPIKEPYKWAQKFSKSSKTISKGIIPETKKQSVLQKTMLFVRGNFFIPDARIAWVKPSVAFLEAYIKENNIETIITTGPPHSLHLIGLQLKAKLNLKWLADFRDPWITIGYHKALKLLPFAEKKHIQLEHTVLNTADTIIVTSFHTKNEFQQKTKQPIHVITNGYDTTVETDVVLDANFTLSHIGTLLSNRNPKVLWQALSELVTDNIEFEKCFKLQLVGEVASEILETIASYNLTKYVSNFGYVSHDEAVKLQKKSQVLLLIEINSDDTKAIIPGKIFEYLASNRPILAIGPQNSDIETIIEKTQSGYYFDYSDHAVLKQKIEEAFNVFLKGNLKSNTKNIETYSRKTLTQSLSELI